MTATALTFAEYDGSGTPRTHQGIPDSSGVYAPSVSEDGTTPTYTWTAYAITPVATPFAFLKIVPPSVKSLRIRSIRISLAGSAVGGMLVLVQRCSDVGTPAGGTTYTTITPNKHMTGDPAWGSVISYLQTAALSVEPTVVAVAASGFVIGTDTTTLTQDFFREFGVGGTEALVVNGANDYIFVSFAGSTVPAGGTVVVEVVGQEV